MIELDLIVCNRIRDSLPYNVYRLSYETKLVKNFNQLEKITRTSKENLLELVKNFNQKLVNKFNTQQTVYKQNKQTNNSSSSDPVPDLDTSNEKKEEEKFKFVCGLFQKASPGWAPNNAFVIDAVNEICEHAPGHIEAVFRRAAENQVSRSGLVQYVRKGLANYESLYIRGREGQDKRTLTPEQKEIQKAEDWLKYCAGLTNRWCEVYAELRFLAEKTGKTVEEIYAAREFLDLSLDTYKQLHEQENDDPDPANIKMRGSDDA